tara:strand:+ start:7801 stop:9399 length:1599 start_codon:yes stop_codon:yes gene_type:complete
MEINNLLESSNTYKSMQADAAKLADKWSASGLLEGLGEKQTTNMAVILENQAKQIVAEANSTNVGGAAHGGGAGEQWAGVALPLVRKVFAQIVAQDFVSVQPMNLPSGLVFYLDFKYGTSTNGFNDGNNLYGNVSSASAKMSVDEEVADGLYGAGRFGYSINQVAVNKAASQVAATSASIAYEDGVDPGDFFILRVGMSGTDFDTEGVRAFTLATGSTTISFDQKYTSVNGNNVDFVVASASLAGHADGANLTVRYHKQPLENDRGDFEADSGVAVDTSITIPEIDVKLASEAIVAKTRKLKAQWTPEFAQDLNAYHSIDAEAELTSLLSEYISMEIDLEILDMLIQNAVTTERWSVENNKVWTGTTAAGSWTTSTSDFYNTQGQWFQTLGTKIQKVSNKIHQKTLRGGANFLVCSPNVATILESIPGYAASTDGDAMEFNMGVQRVGSLANRFKVYKNPYMTENTILLGFRGSQFLETGAVYAPYVPLLMTPLVYDPETFTPRKGLMTRYAKKMIRPEFYGRIFVSDIDQI